jgi:single-strand binding protein
MNKTILLGRLTKNPEIKFSQINNVKVVTFSIAVNRKYVKQGEERQADFFNIVAYSKLAEFVERFLKQGIQICVLGRFQTRNYEDKNGVKRYVTEIIAEEIDFADSYTNIEGNTDNTEKTISEDLKEKDTSEDFISNGDDLPF